MRLGEAQTDRSIWGKRKGKRLWDQQVAYQSWRFSRLHVQGIFGIPVAADASNFAYFRYRRTSADLRGFVLTSVLTRPLFLVFSLGFTYEKRRGRESNPRIAVLQTATLPLGYPAAAQD